MAQLRWWALAAAAALAAIGASLALVSRKARTPKPVVVAPSVDSVAPCVDVATLPSRVLASADTAGLITENEPGTQVRVDGEVVFGTFAKAARISAEEHTLRVEAAGVTPVELRLHFVPFTPVLVDTQVSDAGLSVFVVGAACSSCGGITSELPLVPPTEPRAAALADANEALATGDWNEATTELSEVPMGLRRGAPFVHALAATQAIAGMKQAGLKTLATLGPLQKQRVDDFAAMEAPEQARRADVALRRWNLLTERYQRLADKFASSEVHGSVTAINGRMNALSVAFSAAAKDSDVIGEEATIEATEQVLTQLVKDLRALKPNDCAWQAAITSTM